MDGAEKIINKIKNDAQQQAESNIKKAREEAEAIIKAAEEDALKQYNSIVEKTQNEVEEKRKRLISMAELEARKIKLKAKQDLISEVFSMANQKINSMSPEEYRNVLADMILRLMPKGDEEIIVSEEDRQKLGSAFIEIVNSRLENKGIKGNMKYSIETRETGGGFILKSGNIETNSSFSSILRMKYNDIEAEIIKVLFH